MSDYTSVVVSYEFRQHLHIPHESPDDGVSGQKHAVSGIERTFACMLLTPPFLFIGT
jgi:hypothetical protein